MRKTREVARLKASGLSIRQIARSCQIARSTVSDYLGRLKAVGLAWPFPPDLSEEELDGRLFANREGRGPDASRPVPEWSYIHKELRRKGVTVTAAVKIPLSADLQLPRFTTCPSCGSSCPGF